MIEHFANGTGCVGGGGVLACFKVSGTRGAQVDGSDRGTVHECLLRCHLASTEMCPTVYQDTRFKVGIGLCCEQRHAYSELVPIYRKYMHLDQAGIWGKSAQAHFGRFGEKPYAHSFR